MTTTPKPEPASDEELEEFFSLLQSYGCESIGEGVTAKVRCSVCFGPWFSLGDDGPIEHDPDCSTLTGHRVKARVEADRGAYEQACKALATAREQNRAKDEQIARLRDALSTIERNAVDTRARAEARAALAERTEGAGEMRRAPTA